MQEIKDICITLNELDTFDPRKVIFDASTTEEFDINGQKITNSVTKGYYLENGIKHTLFFCGPAQHAFGPNYSYDLKIPKDKQTKYNAKGLQIMYPMTSLKTIKEPTPEEKAFKALIDGLWKRSIDTVGEERAKGKDSKMHRVASSSYFSAKDTGLWEEAVKVPYDYSKKEKSQEKDMTKPAKMYVNLITKGKDEKLTCKTNFYGPGDRKINPVTQVGKKGILEPVFRFDGLWHGGHGDKPYGTSLRFKLYEANFTPESDINDTSRRFIGKNNSLPTEEEGSEEEGDSQIEKPDTPVFNNTVSDHMLALQNQLTKEEKEAKKEVKKEEKEGKKEEKEPKKELKKEKKSEKKQKS